MQATTSPVDPVRLDAFLGHAVQDMGAAMTAPLVVLGDCLGLYRAPPANGPAPSGETAAAVRCRARSVDFRGMPAGGIAVLKLPVDADLEPGIAELAAFWWP